MFMPQYLLMVVNSQSPAALEPPPLTNPSNIPHFGVSEILKEPATNVLQQNYNPFFNHNQKDLSTFSTIRTIIIPNVLSLENFDTITSVSSRALAESKFLFFMIVILKLLQVID